MTNPFSDPSFHLTRRLSLRRGLAIGAAAVLTCIEAAPAQAGYGRCSKCNCPGFENNYADKDMCYNCGHNYTAHW